jgi:hypothetical protein
MARRQYPKGDWMAGAPKNTAQVIAHRRGIVLRQARKGLLAACGGAGCFAVCQSTLWRSTQCGRLFVS